MPERKVKREFKPVPDVRPGDPGADPFQIALAVRPFFPASYRRDAR